MITDQNMLFFHNDLIDNKYKWSAFKLLSENVVLILA